VPVSPTLAENLAATVLDLYLDAESSLLQRIARSLQQGLDAPAWAERQLLLVQTYRAQAARVLVQLEQQATVAVGDAISTAWNRGTAAAIADLADLDPGGPLTLDRVLPGARAVEALVADTVTRVTATHPRILRATEDVYRQVIADVASRTLLGVETRRDTAQEALNRFARRGVTGFVDRAGRGWSMEAYAEMAVRTATAHAAVDAHSTRLQQAGHDLVVVSDAPQECKLCRPWEGKVLSLSGSVAGVIEREHATQDGRPVRVNVAGTLAEARSAGLYHPGCRHSHSAFLPGVTRPPTDTADPQGDADRQRLRLLERRVRAAKREEAAAMDDAAARKAGVKVRDAQAAIRTHVATSSAKRIPAREQIGRAT
jgi:hypothetical protein